MDDIRNIRLALDAQIRQREAEQMKESAANRNALYQDYDKSTLVSNLSDDYAKQVYGGDVLNPYIQEAESEADNSEGFLENIKNLFRTINYDMDKQDVQKAFSDLGEAKQEKEDLEKISWYVQLVKERDDLAKRLEKDPSILKLSKDQIVALSEQYNDYERQIKELDDYFMGEGRTHKVIADNMFAGERTSFADYWSNVIGGSIKRGWNDNNIRLGWSKYGTVGRLAGGAIEGAADILTRPLGVLGELFAGSYNEAESIIKGKFGDARYGNAGNINDYIMNISKDGDPLLKKLYLGQGIVNRPDVVQDLQKKNREQYREIGKAVSDLLDQQEDLKRGRTFGIDGVYNYDAVSENWKKGREDFQNGSIIGALWHPFYATADIASSLDMMKYQIGAMGVDALIRRIPQAFVKKVPGLGTALTLADVGAGITSTELSRKEETSLEAIEAIGERVMQEAQANGVNMQNVLEKIKADGAEMGIDTEALDEGELVKLGVVLDVRTGDTAFENAKRTAQKGINKLINANNALAVEDFAESLPYMSYFADVTKALKFPGRSIRDNFYVGNKTIGQRLNLNQYPDRNSAMFKYSEGMTQTIDGFFDSLVDKVVKKFVEKDMPKAGLFIKHGVKYGAGKLNKIGATAIQEGIEEGQQNLLQNRYMRGEYDDYRKNQSMFDVSEFVRNNFLGATAVADYFGAGFWDPDNDSHELRKAMNIGAWSSMILGGMFHALSNITQANPDNIRGLAQQLRSDDVAVRILADQQKALQDQTHIDMFYDRFMRGGTWNQMYESLQSLQKALDKNSLIVYTDPVTGEKHPMTIRNAKNTLSDEEFQKATGYTKDEYDQVSNTVRKEFIDDDIKLMSTTWNLFNDKNIDAEMKARGHSKNSEYYRQYLRDAVTQVEDFYKTQELQDFQDTEIRRRQQQHINSARMLLDPNVSDETKKQIMEQFPKLVSIIDDLRGTYGDYVSQKRESSGGPGSLSDDEFEKWANNITTGEQLYKAAGKKLIELFGIDEDILHQYRKKKRGKKHKGESREKVSAARLMADRIVASENKNEILRKMFPSAEKKFLDSIKNEEDFINNKNVLHYVDENLFGKINRGRLSEIYNSEDKTLLNEILHGAYVDSTTPLTETEYVVRHLRAIHNYKHIQSALDNMKWAEDLAGVIEKVRYMTGLDVDPTNIKGWVDSYELQIKALQEHEKLHVKNGHTYHDLYKGYEFDDEADYTKVLSDYSLNTALLRSHAIVASAYTSLLANPTSLRRAIFGSKPSEATILDESVDQYDARIAEYESLDDLDKHTNGTEDKIFREDIKKISKEAAWKIIDARVKDRIRRNKVVHRQWEKDQVEPVAAQPVAAPEEVTPVQGAPESSEAQPEMSGAEKELRREFYHEHGQKKTEEEKLEEIIKKRKESQQPEEPKEAPSDLQSPEPKTLSVAEVDTAQETAQLVEQEPVSPEDSISPEEHEASVNTENIENYVPIEPDDTPSGELAEVIDDDNIDFVPTVIDEDEETGQLFENGEPLDSAAEESVRTEEALLEESEQKPIKINEVLDFDEMGDIEDGVGEPSINLIYQTTFYAYQEEDAPMKLTVNGEQITLFNGKPLQPGKRLAEKLLSPTWFLNAKKYYVVTQAQVAKNANPNDTDAFTVVLVIEDEENSYATAFRSLGDVVSVSNKELGRTGEAKEYHISRRQILSDWLYTRNMDISKMLRYINKTIQFPVKKQDETDQQYEKRIVGYRRQVVDAYKVAVNQYARELYSLQYAQLHRDNPKAKRRGEFEWDKITKNSGESKEAYEERKKQWDEDHKHFRMLARKYFSKPNKTVYSEEQIQEELDKLKENRDQIINAYLDKDGDNYVFPSTPKIGAVVPENVSQSNGSIDNVETPGGAPVFRTITDQDLEIDDIQDLLDSEDILIGIGTGERAKQSGVKQIVSFGHALREEERVFFRKGGLSGKLYWIVSSLLGKGRVPIMLSEEKFDIQHRESDDGGLETVSTRNGHKIKLLIEKVAGKLEVQQDRYRPSAAEVLLYMILGENVLPGFGDVRSIVSLFINEDPGTILDKQPNTNDSLLNNLAAKLLYYGPSFKLEERENESGKKYIERVAVDSTLSFNIGMKQEDGHYELMSYTKDQILSDKNLRQQIVLAIAEQMHWNTDAATFQESASVAIQSSTLGKLIQYLINRDADAGRFDGMSAEEFLNSEVSIMNCPLLSFRIGDFYDKPEDSSTNDLASLHAKRGSVMAWMIKSGHIVTDASENVFKAPFVFANGVKTPNKSSAQSKVSKKAAAPVEQTVIEETPQLTGENEFFDEKKIESAQKRLSNRVRALGGITIPKTLKEIKEKLTDWTAFLLRDKGLKYKSFANKIDVEKNDILDMIILQDRDAEAIIDYSEHGGESLPISEEDDDAMNAVDKEMHEDTVNRLVDKYNKSRGTNIAKSDIEDSVLSYTGRQTQKDSAEVALFYREKESGKVKVLVTNIKQSEYQEEGVPGSDTHFFIKGATGVFSRAKQKGKFNEAEARKWLTEALGIDESNVIVLNGIKAAVDNHEVFGVVDTAVDSITGELFGFISLSRNAGRGIHYHEGWHYVNLLLHDERSRRVIYKAYINSHPWLKLKNLTYADVEERLAEDFRKWMELEEDKSIKGSILRMFNNVLDTILIFTNRNVYKDVFRSIKNGEYSGTPLSKQALKEFHDAYSLQGGVHSIGYYTPTTSENERKGYKKIINHQLYFDARAALAMHFINSYKLETERDLKKLSGVLIDDIYTVLSDWIENSKDILEENKDILREVLNNPATVKKAIQEYFEDLGITVKIKKIKDLHKAKRLVEDDTTDEALLKEEKPDNTWDVFDLSVSKKDNASIRTKLFMKQIPVVKRTLNQDGTVSYKQEYDDYGNEKMWSFRDAWNLITDKLWLCESIDAVDEKGEYKQNSMMGMVKRLADGNVFFRALFDKLSLIDSSKFQNTILKSQLYATINSNKPQVSFLELRDPDSKHNYDDMFDSISDLDSDDYGVLTNTSVSDRQRNWIVNNDNRVSTNKNTLRTWSETILGQGLLGMTNKGKSVVSTEYAKRLEGKIKSVRNLLDTYSNKTIDNKTLVDAFRNKIAPAIQELYDEVGITVDFDVILEQIKGQSNQKEISILDQILTVKSWFDKEELYVNEKGKKVSKKLPQNTIPRVIDAIIEEGLKDDSEKEEFIKYSGNRSPQALDKLFSLFDESSGVYALADAINTIHPSAREFSIKDPSGNTIYPLSSNSFVSDKIRLLSTSGKLIGQQMKKSPYCGHSELLNLAIDDTDIVNTNSHFKLNAFVGIKDGNRNIGADYFGITPMEDYLAKLTMMEGVYKDGKVSGADQLVLPTMADKKTWYSISHRGLKLSHDAMLFQPYRNVLNDIIYKEYEKEHPYRGEDDIDSWKIAARKWYRNLDKDNEQKKSIDKSAKDAYSDGNSGISLLRYSDSTLNRFGNYMLDELNAVSAYYESQRIRKVVKNKNLRVENYHGNVEDGRMDFSGNGGKFRYFYDVILFTDKNGNTYNLNQRLLMLFELQKKIEAGEAVNVASDDPLYEVIGGSVISSKDKSQLDGFELVRAELKRIEKQFFNNGFVSSAIKTSINDIFIRRTIEELNSISEKNSPVKLVEKDDNGNYVPVGIPVHLLNKYADAINQKINGKHVSDAYSDLGFSTILQDALFSLIANYVVNSAMSIIEFEKVFSGDPAFYKWKTAKDKPTTTLNVLMQFENGQVAKENIVVDNTYDTFSDKIKRLGSTLSPGDEVRLYYSKEELEKKGRRMLSVDKYTNMNVEDVEIQSVFLDVIENSFKKQLLVDTIRHLDQDKFKLMCTDNGMSFEQGIEKIYNDDKFFKSVYDSFGNRKANIEKALKIQMKPYTEINVCDAQVFIRPEMYRRIRIGLGQWSNDDEKAYMILEGKNSKYKNGEWMKDPEAYKVVRNLQLYPLKMSYFQNQPLSESLNNNKTEYNKPILNKMAIFPLFRFAAGNGVGAQIYSRMNRKGNELDMITFKSAAKVGAVQKGVVMNDGKKTGELQLENIEALFEANSSQYIDYNDDENNADYGSVKSHTEENTAPVEIQHLSNLRFQLNTEAHDATERSMGTLMFKLAFSSIIDDATYGPSKKTGALIKQEIMSIVNSLADLGVTSIHDEFFEKAQDGSFVVDEEKVLDWIKRIVENNNLGSTAELIIDDSVAAGVSRRAVFENSATSIVESEVIDIETSGGSAVQQSDFGFTAYTNKTVGTQTGAFAVQFNDGKMLKWSLEDNSMEVMLSMNFFRGVLPKEINGKKVSDCTFEEQRQWLIDNDIIKGTKTDGTQSNPEPFGVGYRIPTQGLSSMFGFTVADVLPPQCGDLIIVPPEFTAQTGSDFDVDKLYLATKSYKNGKKEILNPEDVTKGGLTNALLENYLSLLLDNKNYSEARASIDTFTKMLKSELIDADGVLREPQSQYAPSFMQLTPFFQMRRKMEFSVGKEGIAPFALNVTNLALTQLVHLTFRYDSHAKQYGFGHFDQIDGKDGLKISGWLSAMVNAHVDVAKDPYIFDLNVNKATYNYANFLIRAGMGLSTFSFLAQDSIKNIAAEVINSGGIYGSNLLGNSPDEEIYKISRPVAIKNEKRSLLEKLKSLLTDYLNSKDKKLSPEELTKLKKLIDYLSYELLSPNKKKDFKGDIPKLEFDRSKVFDKDYAIKQIKNKRSNKQSDNLSWLEFQIACVRAFEEMEKYAQATSDLVSASQIDTKKFGNTIHQHINFANKIEHFIKDSGIWTLNIPDYEERFKKPQGGIDAAKASENALNTYFNDSYLMHKFTSATRLIKQILSTLLFTATDLFEQVFKNIMCIFNGGVNGFYDEEKNADKLQSINDAIDNVLRFNALFNVGSTIKNLNKNAIDFTMGGNKAAVINKMKQLLYGDETHDPLYKRLYTFKHELKTEKAFTEYSDLVDDEGNTHNDLLDALIPMSPTKNVSVGRINMIRSNRDTNIDQKNRLVASFAQLLSSKNDKVAELARDLAFYAYYTLYDLDMAGSFFDLIPPEYREQYDIALKKSLRGLYIGGELATNYASMLTNSKYEIIDADPTVNMMDVICRNYWYDNNIVPRYYPQKPSDNLNKSEVKIYGSSLFVQNVDGFPRFIAMTYDKKVKGGMYFKVQNQGKSLLYRRVGIIQRKFVGGKLEGKTLSDDISIYMPIPKAGIHSGKVHMFEFYADYETPTSFDENKIPAAFSMQKVMESVQKIVDEYNQLPTEGKDGRRFEAEIVWGHQDIPKLYDELSLDTYKQFSSETEEQVDRVKIIKYEDRVGEGHNAWKEVARKAYNHGCIIQLTTSDDVEPNVPDKYKDKVIRININKAISDKDYQLIKEYLSDPVKRIYFSIDRDIDVSLSESDIESFLRSYGEISAKDAAYYRDNINVLQGKIKQHKIDMVVYNLLTKLANDDISGVAIQSLFDEKNKNTIKTVKAVSFAATVLKQYGVKSSVHTNVTQVAGKLGRAKELKKAINSKLYANIVDADVSEMASEFAKLLSEKEGTVKGAEIVKKVNAELSKDDSKEKEPVKPQSVLTLKIDENKKDEAENKKCSSMFSFSEDI